MLVSIKTIRRENTTWFNILTFKELNHFPRSCIQTSRYRDSKLSSYEAPMVPCFGVQIGFTDSVLVCLLDKLHLWVFVGMFDATNPAIFICFLQEFSSWAKRSKWIWNHNGPLVNRISLFSCGWFKHIQTWATSKTRKETWQTPEQCPTSHPYTRENARKKTLLTLQKSQVGSM